MTSQIVFGTLRAGMGVLGKALYEISAKARYPYEDFYNLGDYWWRHNQVVSLPSGMGFATIRVTDGGNNRDKLYYLKQAPMDHIFTLYRTQLRIGEDIDTEAMEWFKEHYTWNCIERHDQLAQLASRMLYWHLSEDDPAVHLSTISNLKPRSLTLNPDWLDSWGANQVLFWETLLELPEYTLIDYESLPKFIHSAGLCISLYQPLVYPFEDRLDAFTNKQDIEEWFARWHPIYLNVREEVLDRNPPTIVEQNGE